MKAKDKIQGNKHQQMLGGIPSKKHGSDFFQMVNLIKRNFSEKQGPVIHFRWLLWWGVSTGRTRI